MIIEQIISSIENQNKLHAKKLKKTLSGLDESFYNESEVFFNNYIQFTKNIGRDLDYGINSYLKMLDDVLVETIEFIRSGKYSSESFDEVNKRVYSNPEVMEYYMHGLLLSQFLWFHHYKIYRFFKDNISKYNKTSKQYLEIGAGHGLFMNEAIKQLSSINDFHLVDISPKSLDLAKQFIKNDSVEFILCDIFKYSSSTKYDFITMGEVLEHIEQPLELLKRLHLLLEDNGTLYFTTPTNAPAIDHIYLFKNTEEIKELIDKAGFKIIDSIEAVSEDVPIEDAERKKISVMFGAFIKKK